MIDQDFKQLAKEALRFLHIKDILSMPSSLQSIVDGLTNYLVKKQPDIESQRALDRIVKTHPIVVLCVLHMKSQCCKSIEDCNFYTNHQAVLRIVETE